MNLFPYSNTILLANKDKRTKAEEEKENHPFKHKFKVLLTLFLCLAVVLLTAIYMSYLVAYKDKN